MLYEMQIDMDAVTVSPKYQVVIPKAVRERTHIKPGEKLQVLSFRDRHRMICNRFLMRIMSSMSLTWRERSPVST